MTEVKLLEIGAEGGGLEIYERRESSKTEHSNKNKPNREQIVMGEATIEDNAFVICNRDSVIY